VRSNDRHFAFYRHNTRDIDFYWGNGVFRGDKGSRIVLPWCLAICFFRDFFCMGNIGDIKMTDQARPRVWGASDVWRIIEYQVDGPCEFVEHSAYLDLLSEARKLRDASRLLRIQDYGVRNSWAGVWTFCPIKDCVRKSNWPKNLTAPAYAFGGNWLGDEAGCPECKLTDAIKAFDAKYGEKNE
jgi:hypothetical protein